MCRQSCCLMTPTYTHTHPGVGRLWSQTTSALYILFTEGQNLKYYYELWEGRGRKKKRWNSIGAYSLSASIFTGMRTNDKGRLHHDISRSRGGIGTVAAWSQFCRLPTIFGDWRRNDGSGMSYLLVFQFLLLLGITRWSYSKWSVQHLIFHKRFSICVRLFVSLVFYGESHNIRLVDDKFCRSHSVKVAAFGECAAIC